MTHRNIFRNITKTARPVWAMHGHYGNSPRFVSCDPPCVPQIPQPLPRLHTCAGAPDAVLGLFLQQVLRSSTLTFQRGHRHLHIDAYVCIVSWPYLALKNVFTRPEALIFIFVGVIYLSCILVFGSLLLCSSVLFESVFKDIFPIFVLDYVSHDQNKNK